ncbi:hypothetical protein An04g10390 [Aspergillus niger]|uniref:Uncharacterized protein n=2 Tax=Aspergillus niger TaxID=5061 RepID=A2QKF0_ASPNC|nr:hypothetical protein An04g10390 [Aspergillus niger]CAK44819.1 hypothetical protein An04g10390 [Aspergillus niger]
MKVSLESSSHYDSDVFGTDLIAYCHFGSRCRMQILIHIPQPHAYVPVPYTPGLGIPMGADRQWAWAEG